MRRAERFALKEHLGEQGIPVEDMVEAGLLIAGDDIPVPYDRFRDRVMFPISDCARPHHRLRRPRARQGRAGEIPELAGDAALPQGRDALQRRRTPRTGRRTTARTLIAVEGYVDVIAMVTAGFAATVAPLGTALTEDQLGLLWRMADEPILCFDGDKAGRRAAYRAVDLALPLLKPGKSLRFALLPEGQDPDDLVRSGGREAVDEVLASARPLADMLWTRETESRPPSTRRSGAPRWRRALSEVTRHDRRRSRAPLLPAGFRRAAAPLFAPAGSRARPPAVRRPGAAAARERQAAAIGLAARPRRRAREPYAPSARARRQPDHARLTQRDAAARGADPAGGGQPSLAPGAASARNSPNSSSSIRTPISCAAASWKTATGAGPTDAETLRRGLAARGLASAAGAGPCRDHAHFGLAGASRRAGRATFRTGGATSLPCIARQRTLNRELKDAERALGEDPSDANLAWLLRDVQGADLSALEGTEALIEGFGASSGRRCAAV